MVHYWKHFKTITKHRWEVCKACFHVGLFKQGLLHDLSKYSPVEFITSAKYYQGNRSPINAEKEDKGYSLAWQHHKGRNPHHWEYWVDNLGPKRIETVGVFTPSIRTPDDIYNTNSWNGKQVVKGYDYVSKPTAIEMPYNYVLEMICDWIGAGKVYEGKNWTNKSPLTYYEKNKKEMLLNDKTRKLIEHWLNAIANEGLKSFYHRVKIWR